MYLVKLFSIVGNYKDFLVDFADQGVPCISYKKCIIMALWDTNTGLIGVTEDIWCEIS